MLGIFCDSLFVKHILNKRDFIIIHIEKKRASANESLYSMQGAVTASIKGRGKITLIQIKTCFQSKVKVVRILFFAFRFLFVFRFYAFRFSHFIGVGRVGGGRTGRGSSPPPHEKFWRGGGANIPFAPLPPSK